MLRIFLTYMYSKTLIYRPPRFWANYRGETYIGKVKKCMNNTNNRNNSFSSFKPYVLQVFSRKLLGEDTTFSSETLPILDSEAFLHAYDKVYIDDVDSLIALTRDTCVERIFLGPSSSKPIVRINYTSLTEGQYILLQGSRFFNGNHVGIYCGLLSFQGEVYISYVYPEQEAIMFRGVLPSIKVHTGNSNEYGSITEALHLVYVHSFIKTINLVETCEEENKYICYI
jgi:hypothetical protein